MLRPDEGIVTAEHQAPAEQQKAQGRNRKDDEVLGEDVDRVLGPGKARFHAGKAQVHEEDEYRGEEHP